MDRKQKRDYSLIIIVLVAICGVLVLLRGHGEEQNTPVASASQQAETVPSVTFPPVPMTTLMTAPQTTTSESTTTTVQTTSASETTTAAPQTENWMLTLVNSSHPLPEGHSIDLTELRGGVSVDSRMYPDLQAMFDQMRAEGMHPFVREGYRTHADQEAIMQERIRTHLAQGYSEEQALSLAREYVAEPGTSEHELGLAVDINAESEGERWGLYRWLADHAYEYGFILRYPEGGEGITGIAYEPWHYRYVGKEAAAEIFSQRVTLEEYLGAA